MSTKLIDQVHGKYLLYIGFFLMLYVVEMELFGDILFQEYKVILNSHHFVKQYLSFISLVLCCYLPFFLCNIYGLLFIPMEKIRILEDTECAPNDLNVRAKRAGPVPPPYPNGWYKILNSDELKVKEAKEIRFLGKVLVAFRGEDEKVKVIDGFCTHLGAKRAGPVPPPYPNGWYKILNSDELKVKEAKEIRFLGKVLVAFRGEDEKVKVIDGFCTHLGASLGINGTVKDNCIRCPFHGWEFDEDGKCTNIPYTDSIPKNANSVAHKVVEANQHIYVFYHSENEDPTWNPPVIPELNDGSFTKHGITKHEVSAHIQEIPENGSDVAHLNILHTDFVIHWLSKFITHTWTANWEPGKNDEKHLAKIDLTQELNFFGKYIPLTHIDVKVTQTGPGIVSLHFDTVVGKLYVIETVTPIQPMLQEATHTIYADWKVPRFVAKIVLYSLSIQFERDIPIWNNKTFKNKPVLVKGDGAINKFRRWYSQFYTESSNNNNNNKKEKPLSLDW
eukprot:TRINITY_DN611_c3_g1_i1.p1 TRINITY_DN611_c3_g1~~TRINITY_DN611_c3_g1_i1.p1  ORF type:complete len:504 (-),score=140.15 TRINITY_DN611_c3_g1_i1:42-1553(-)